MMTNNSKGNEIEKKKYEELVKELREKLPNIILPSMGMHDDISPVGFDGKNYIRNNDIKEE